MGEKRPSKVEIKARKRLLDSWIKVDEAEVSFEQFSGEMSPPIRRQVAVRGVAVAALLRHRSRDSFIFIRQFRFPVWDETHDWLLEIPAGMVEKGERPEETMRREIVEETGYEALSLTEIANCFPAPGFSSGRIVIFTGEVDGEPGHAPGDGDEDIGLVELSRTEAFGLLDKGAINDAKTLIALLSARREP